MKRNFLFLIGFFTVALVAVIFIACDKKDKSNGNASLIVGKWKYVESYYGDLSMVVTFNKDNTGKAKETYDGYSLTSTFDYSYNNKTDVLTIDIDDAEYSYVFDGYDGYLMKFNVEWMGEDRFYLSDYYYDYDGYEIGPFIRQ